jgi:hypothetical protein
MANTYRKMAFNVLESLKQVYDDPKITIPQVVHWILMAVNNINYQHIKKTRTGVYTNKYEVTSVLDNGGKYILLPEDVVDLDNDMGIVLLEYCNKTCDDVYPFSRTTAGSKWSLNGNKHTKPSIESPFFYRVGDKLYLLGIDCVNIDCLWLYLNTPVSSMANCDFDSVIPVPAQYGEVLFYRVMNLAKFGMVSVSERNNDGSSATNRAAPQVRMAELGNQGQQQQQQNEGEENE